MSRWGVDWWVEPGDEGGCQRECGVGKMRKTSIDGAASLLEKSRVVKRESYQRCDDNTAEGGVNDI